MRIENFRKESNADRVKIIADVIWENCDRDNQEVFLETTAEFEEDFVINPNSWLLACTLPAMRYGESRIAINAPISSELKDGLLNAMRCLIDWHGGATPRPKAIVLNVKYNLFFSGDRVVVEDAPSYWSWASPFTVQSIDGEMARLEMVDELVEIERLSLS